ncbi:MAG: putative ABC transporter permease [Atopobiaceae bacterium]|jgi:uncharacterized membrane protein
MNAAITSIFGALPSPYEIAHMLSQVILWITVYAIGGWVYETIVCSVQARHVVKRGFLHGPVCPIYGVGAVGNYLALGWIANPVALFLVGAVVSTAFEYLVGWALERLFGKRWWSYDGWLLNIKGRVCLAGALVFGVFTVLAVDVLQPMIIGMVNMAGARDQLVLGTLVTLGYLVDTATSCLANRQDSSTLGEVRGRIARRIRRLA